MKVLKKSYLAIGIGLLLSFSLFSFLFLSKKKVNANELRSYISDSANGLLKKSNAGKIEVKAMFKPSSLLAAQDNTNDTALVRNYNNHFYFIVSLAQDNKEMEYSLIGDKANFGNTLQTMMFGMRDNALLISSNQDTVGVKEFMYPRMYGSTNSSSFIFVFDNTKVKEAEWIDLKLNFDELGINEMFRFEKNDIENIPDLKK